MSDAIEALSEYKYLLESMGHDAQSTGPYMRCLDAIAALQAMQGEAASQPAVPEGYVLVPIDPNKNMIGVIENEHDVWGTAHDLYAALLSAAKGDQ
jgi:hypothetical protein